MKALPSSSEKNWLIRSSTRILGPFTLSEVKENLATRQISIIDEVRTTQSRWSYIREHKEFLEVVRSVREELDSISEKTMTLSLAQQTITKTDPVTPHVDELTPTPPPLVPKMKDVTAKVESNFRAQPDTKTKSYGASADRRVQNQIKGKSKAVRWLLLGAVCVVTAFAGFRFFMQSREKDVNYEELLNSALRYRSIGLHEEALAAYKKAAALKEPNIEAQLQMAPLFISEERQTLVGRRILERGLTMEGRSRAEKVDAYVGVALSYLLDGDLKEAEETLQKALGYDPTNYPAQLNMAIVQMKKGNYFEAATEFGILLKKNPQSALALYGKGHSLLELSKVAHDNASLAELVEDIKLMSGRTSYLRHELALMRVYAENLRGNVDELQTAIANFLKLNPNETENFVKNPQMDWRITQWDYLEQVCADLYSQVTIHAEVKALRATCLMEVNRDAEALRFLEEALAESPRDPFVLASHAAYLKKVGRISEATTVLRMPELENLSLKNQMLGEICILTKDGACAQQAFATLYSRNDRDAMTFYGLSWVANHGHDRAKTFEYLRAGLQLEPQYIPLIRLRDSLESE